MPTNITAEPGRAGYLETTRLRGWSTEQVVRDFRSQISAQSKLAVVYDHPFFAGIQALEQVGELVQVAREAGFCVETISEAARSLAWTGGPAAAVP